MGPPESQTGVAKDIATNVVEVDEFNKYINPGPNTIWDLHCTIIHDLYANEPRIVSIESMNQVWRQFRQFIQSNDRPDKIVVLVAYNGVSYDLKEVWKVTQAPNSCYHMLP